MIPARNAIDVHVQDSVINDKLLLPILIAYTQCTCSLHMTLTMLDVVSLCIVGELSFTPINTRPTVCRMMSDMPLQGSPFGLYFYLSIK